MDRELLKIALEELEGELNPSKVLVSKTSKLQESFDKMARLESPEVDEFLAKFVQEVKGEKGDKGDLPVKGEDYFTQEDIEYIKELATPVKDVDYFDGKDGESIVGPQGVQGERGIQGEKGDKGDVGPQGEPGKDGKDADLEEVVTLIKKQKIDISDIKNYQQLLPKKGSGYRLDDQRWHGGGATASLSNLASVAINTALLPGTSDSIALGSATKQWSDLFLGSAGVINFNNGDVTLTHSSNLLTIGGGALTLTTGDLTVSNGAIQADSQVLFNSAVYTQFQANVANVNLNFKTVAGTGTIIFSPNAIDTFTIDDTGITAVTEMNFAAPTTSIASFNLPTGTAPSSPVDGDVFRVDNTDTGLKIRINGITKTIVVA